MLRQLLHLLSPGGARARLSVLIFHRVRGERDPLFPGELDATRFAGLLDRLKGWCNVLPLTEAVRRLRGGTLPARSLCITFDDGYADNCTVALPALRAAGLPATFFVTTGYLDGGRMWNDTVIESVRGASGATLDLSDLGLGAHPLDGAGARRAAIEALLRAIKYRPRDERESIVAAIADRAGAALPDDLMLTRRQVRELRSAGMTIGAHTVTHPILAREPDERARREILDGKRELEALLGEAVTLFAYPNGQPGDDYAARHVAMARAAGFEAAVTTARGAASRATDPFEIPRYTPWGPTPLRFGLRLAQNLRRSAHVAA
jgi:peptidoglycan/xylan/chitin deacetylase (PgdA/CDA1 family)